MGSGTILITSIAVLFLLLFTGNANSTLVKFVVVVSVILMITADLIGFRKQNKDASNKKKEIDDTLNKLNIKDEFSVTQKIIGSDINAGLAIDEFRKKVCLINCCGHNVSARIMRYEDILSCEIFEDGLTVNKTIRSSQIGSALIGGIALGGVGAIIGGLSGDTETSKRVKRIDLRLTVNDLSNPTHEVNFINSETELEKTNALYQATIKQVRHWQGLIEITIKRADMEYKNNKNIVESRSGFIADELRKLAELRDAGVISDSEFQQQKAKVLSMTG